MSVKLEPKSNRIGPVEIIGQSPQTQAMLDFIYKAAANDFTVLLEGESGTGKELMAHAIHFASARASGPFVAVNCGAINHELIESELFGHEKGAFTGAIARKLGRFERADGGTLFLDEVGELPHCVENKKPIHLNEWWGHQVSVDFFFLTRGKR
ncbi:MAG: sigma-54 factor interaction domain-containing protein [Blastocatellia bacterium]